MVAFADPEQAVRCGIDAATRHFVSGRTEFGCESASTRASRCGAATTCSAATSRWPPGSPQQADGGEILVSEPVRDAVGATSIAFDDGRDVELKGFSGTHRLYAVEVTGHRCRAALLRLGLGQPLVQTGPDVVGGVGIAAPLIARDQNATSDDTGDTGQADPLPDAVHARQCA